MKEQREIKFRAYHEQSKEMFWFDIMWGNCDKGKVGGGYIGMVPFGMTRENTNSYNGNQTLIDPAECYIMQYTGLKDKNGNEIYEGDIIIFEGGKDYPRVIEWHILGLRVKQINSENNFRLHYPFVGNDGYDTDWEIIGNIYEQPNLLNQ